MGKYDNASGYACKNPDLKFVRDRVFGAFEEPYEEINSGMWGDYFNSIEGSEREIKVYNNLNGEGELNEPDLADYPVLIDIVDVADFVPYDKFILNDPELRAVLYDRYIGDDDDGQESGG